MNDIAGTLRLAATKDSLHKLVDDLRESDSVVFVIGERMTDEEGCETGRVNIRRRNAHHFEAVGILHQALTMLSWREAE